MQTIAAAKNIAHAPRFRLSRWRVVVAIVGALAGMLLVARSATAIDQPAWEQLLNPKSFRAAFTVLMASLALTLGALGLLAWAGPRRAQLTGRVAIVIAALILLAIAAYWLTRPLTRGPV